MSLSSIVSSACKVTHEKNEFARTYFQPILVVQIGVIITTKKVNNQLLMTDSDTPRLRVRKLVISAG